MLVRMMKRILLLLVLLVATASLAARSNLWYRYAAIVLEPDAVEASSHFPAQEDITYTGDNVLDDDHTTAWFATREDQSPVLTFRFDSPIVLHAIQIVNGWTESRENWEANSRAHECRITLDDGTQLPFALLDEDYEQTFQFQETVDPLAIPTTTVRLEILSAHPGARFPEIGLTEVKFFGRRHHVDALFFEDLATCTVTFESEVTIPPNAKSGRFRQRSGPVLYLFEDVDNRFEIRGYDIEFGILPPEPSPNERVVRVGRSFDVTNIISHTDEAMEFTCADGTRFYMETQRYGSPRGPFGELTVHEMNELFEGMIEFVDFEGRQVSDY